MNDLTGYDFYLSDVRLPVTPDEITVKIGNNNKTMTLVNEGEVNFLKTPALTEYSFDFLLPAREGYAFAKYTDGFQPPKYFFDLLDAWKTAEDELDRVFQFIVYRALPDGTPQEHTDVKVSLEDYSFKQSHKEGFDYVVTVKLKRWVDRAVKKLDITLPEIRIERKRTAKKAETRITAAKNETASTAVKKATGKEFGVHRYQSYADTYWKTSEYSPELTARENIPGKSVKGTVKINRIYVSVPIGSANQYYIG
jgi:hypothetical protein